jgi:O-antigen/teichoic acid export membrane protein
MYLDGSFRRLIGRGSVYTLGFAAQALGFLLVVPVITRRLGPDGFGTVAVALVVEQILVVVAGLGLPGAVTRFYFDEADGSRKARALTTTTGLAAVLVVAAAELTGPLWARVFSSIGYGASLRIAVWTALPAAFVSATQAVLRASDRAGAFAVVTGIITIGGQGAGLVVCSVWSTGPVGYLAGWAGGYVVASVVGAVLVAPRLRGSVQPRLLRSGLALALPLVPHSLALYVMTAGDRIVVEHFSGLAAVGRYQVAYAIGSLGMVAVSALNNAWAPAVLGSHPDRRWPTLAETTAALCDLAVPVVGGIAVVAPVILTLLAPASYDRGSLTVVVAPVALSVLPYIRYIASGIVLFQEKRTGVLGWATPVGATLNIALNVVLVPRVGLKGAALATLVAYVIQAEIVHWAIRRVEVPWRRGVEVRAWLQSVAVAAVGVAVPSSGAWLILRVAGVGAALVVLLLRGRGHWIRSSGA